MLAERTLLFSTSGTSSARAAAHAAAAQGKKIIDLSAGELSSQPPAAVSATAIAAIRAGVNRYTDTLGLEALRHAIANELARSTGQHWDISEVAVTAGAKQALFHAAMVILNPADEVIILQPYWATFPAQVRIAGAIPVSVAVDPESHLPQIEMLATAISPATRAIVINTPNNPTGAVYGREHLSAIAALAMEHDLWVIFDECYSEFVYEPCSHENILLVAPALRERTLIVQSFSKTLAITGWRIGYLAGPPNVISAARALQSHTTSNPNVIAQHAVLAYLEADDHSFALANRMQLAHNRARGKEILSALREVHLAAAQGGFYFYLDIRRLPPLIAGGKVVTDSQALAQFLLTEAGVATVPGSAFGDAHGLRLSYGVPLDVLERGLESVVTALNRQLKRRANCHST